MYDELLYVGVVRLSIPGWRLDVLDAYGGRFTDVHFSTDVELGCFIGIAALDRMKKGK